MDFKTYTTFVSLFKAEVSVKFEGSKGLLFKDKLLLSYSYLKVFL